MKRDYEKKLAVLIGESLGISPSRVTVTTDEARATVTVKWQTSSLLRGEKRDALVAQCQALLPAPLTLSVA